MNTKGIGIYNDELRPKNIINEEVEWDKKKIIVSKTDIKGTILYANNVFADTCGYSKIELVGEDHNLIRHPDMPKAAFKALWDALKREENFHAIVKNLTRDGRYYWVITDFTIDKDREGSVIGYTARRKSVPDSVIKKIEPIYKTLLEIETFKGEEASEMYLKSFLEEEVGKSYEEFVVDLFEEEMKKQKSFNPFKRTLNWFFK